MKKLKHILLTVLSFLAISFTKSGELSAHVEKTFFLKGKVGERELVIKMLCYDEMPTRHIYYYFRDDKRDRYLVGNLKEHTWKFIQEAEKGRSDSMTGVILEIADDKNGVWKGTWADSTGSTVDLVLNPMPAGAVPSSFNYLPFIQELDVYERFRLSDIHFIRTNTVTLTNHLVSDWFLEKRSGISFFRVRAKNNRLNTDSLNATLATIQLSLIQKYFGYHPEKRDTKIETIFHYQTNELMSFEVTSTTAFRTNQPSKMRELFTIDIKSGQQVNLEDLIWFDPTAQKPRMDDLFKIYKYRKTVFAPRILQLLMELYPEKMKTDSCSINKAETWALPSWYLTSTGILFSFNPSDVCPAVNWAIIPFAKLTPFMEGKYQLTKTGQQQPGAR